MQPTLRHTPPGRSFSTTSAFFFSCPRRIPATYPPGPAPMTIASTRNASVATAAPYSAGSAARPPRSGLVRLGPHALQLGQLLLEDPARLGGDLLDPRGEQ